MTIRRCSLFFGLLIAALSAGAQDLPVIEWQQESLRLVAAHGCYARMIRLKNGEILCCYQFRKQSWVKRSKDDGQSWDSGIAVTSYMQGVAANPELVELKSGRVLLGYNERPDDGESHYRICVAASDDGGRKWSVAKPVFEAGRTRLDGCWEPAFLQYPDGEVQLFFANEAPYTYSDDQEISVMGSRNNGDSWDSPKTLSYRSGARDGMPVPSLLKDGAVVVAIEDSGLDGPMKPVILRDSPENRWKKSIIKGNSSARSSALLNPLATDIYAGAPYLCSLPSGITLLSVQSRERRPFEEPAVYVGDVHALNFTNRSFPFHLDEGVEGSWNSLFVKNKNTVVLVSTTEINGKGGIWAIDGKVVDRQ